MAPVEKGLGDPPDLISSLKDLLRTRQGQTASELPHALPAERKNLGATDRPRSEEPESICDIAHEDDRPAVLVTNEDGIQASGLRALVGALVRGGCCDVYVCAPDSEKSGIGHSFTVRDTLAVSLVDIEGVASYEVSGTLTDCVSLSLSGVLFSQKKPLLVLSGINKGSNCGYQIFYSGIVAGAREAYMCGVPSMALSLNWKNGESNERDFEAAAAVLLPLIHAALCAIKKGLYPTGFFSNINVPTDPSQHKGFRVTRQGTTRSAARWRIVPSQRCISGTGLCKENAIGARLAQLGLAASAMGAARRKNSCLKNTEIESVAGPDNGSPPSNSQKKQYYVNDVSEIEVGGTDIDDDFGALQEGYVSVTPLGLLTHLEPESSSWAADWIASVEAAVPSVL